MNNKRIFIFASEGLPSRYGIGKFIDILYHESKKVERYDFFFVRRSEHFTQMIISKSNNVTDIQIPYPINSQNKLSFIESLAILCLIDEKFKLTKDDTVHINDNSHFGIIRNVKKYFGCKVIYTMHVLLWQIFYNNDFNRFSIDWSNRKEIRDNLFLNVLKNEQQICEISDFVVVLNNETLSFVKKVYAIKNEKVQLTPNGLSMPAQIETSSQTNQLKEVLGIEDNYKIILYVGRIDRQKGVGYLIQSTITLIKQGHKLKLILVGNGEIDNMIELIYGYWSDIIFTGYVDQEKVYEFYSISDIIVSPTYAEQSSFSILESISFKKPLIVSNIPAFDFLIDNISVLKVDPLTDRPKLTRQISRLLEDDSLGKKLSDNAYNLYLKNYTSDRMFKRYLDLYAKI